MKALLRSCRSPSSPASPSASLPRRPLALALLLAAAPAALAQSQPAGLAGDWGGLRSALAARGIDASVAYTNEVMHNASGGSRQTTAQAGQLSVSARMDLQRLWGWHGARLDVALSKRDGENLNGRAGLDALVGPHEIYGRGNVLRLAELALRQQLFDGRVLLKIGRTTAGADFGYLECDFLNVAYCGSQPGNITDYWYNWPISQWGVMAKVNVDDAHHLQAAVYQINRAYLDTRRALALAPSGTTGALSMLEFGWTPRLHGLAGSYKFGGWYASNVRRDVLDPAVDASATDDTPAALAMRAGGHGGYVAFSQQFSSGDGAGERSGLRGFFNAAVPDRATNPIAHTIAAGLVYRGPWSERPDDEVGLAAAANRYNPRASRRQLQLIDAGLQNPARLQRGTEYNVELFYALKVTEGLILRPDLQWMRNPGARDRDDALIIGLRTSLVF